MEEVAASYQADSAGSAPRGATGPGSAFRALLYRIVCLAERSVAAPETYTGSEASGGGAISTAREGLP